MQNKVYPHSRTLCPRCFYTSPPNGFGGVHSFTSLPESDSPRTKRNAPTLLNVGFNGIDTKGAYAPMFFDLRAKSLEAQLLMPIAAFEEMRGHVFSEASAIDSVLARLRAIPMYRTSFESVFDGINTITVQNLGKPLRLMNVRYWQTMRPTTATSGAANRP